jgi:hypothetical protein
VSFLKRLECAISTGNEMEKEAASSLRKGKLRINGTKEGGGRTSAAVESVVVLVKVKGKKRREENLLERERTKSVIKCN